MLDIFGNINIIFYILAYFVGGIPFGYLIVKRFRINLLEIGSGSIGATNVYRALKLQTKHAKAFSILTIILDSTKGMIIVFVAKILGLSYETQWAIAVLSVLGHCYSPYLFFRGGKGVSTAIGSTILLVPLEGIIGLFAWFITGKIFKVSSLSSLLGVSIGILSSFFIPHFSPSISITSQIGTHTPLMMILFLILYTHIPNIIRLITGQEGRIF